MTATIHTGIGGDKRKDVSRELSKVLADSFAVYQKTHGYHWNIRGPEFFSYHNLLEQQYREIWEALDDLAERIRALGEFAPQGAGTFANLTSIKEGDPETAAADMLQELMRDHETVIATARHAVEIGEAAEDGASVDLLNARLAAHEKHAWMLRSSLGAK